MAQVRPAAEVVLEGGESVLLSCKTVDNKHFYAFSQTDRKVERILLHGIRSNAKHRPLSGVEILRTLKELHDKHVWKLTGEQIRICYIGLF